MKSFIVTVDTNLISGECDPISKGLEYSSDEVTWTEIVGGCPSGTFSVTVLSTPRAKLFVRARTKTGYTPVARAIIRLAIPPTSTEFEPVISSRSDQDGSRGVLNALSYSFTGESLDSGAGGHRGQFHIPGTTYVQ